MKHEESFKRVGEEAAVAIAFQHAVERGEIMPCPFDDRQAESGESIAYFVERANKHFDTVGEAVRALYPETFKDLEVGDE